MSYDINLSNLYGNAVIVLPYNVNGTLYDTVSLSGTSYTSSDSAAASVTIYMSSNTWSGSGSAYSPLTCNVNFNNAVFNCPLNIYTSLSDSTEPKAVNVNNTNYNSKQLWTKNGNGRRLNLYGSADCNREVFIKTGGDSITNDKLPAYLSAVNMGTTDYSLRMITYAPAKSPLSFRGYGKISINNNNTYISAEPVYGGVVAVAIETHYSVGGHSIINYENNTTNLIDVTIGDRFFDSQFNVVSDAASVDTNNLSQGGIPFRLKFNKDVIVELTLSLPAPIFVTRGPSSVGYNYRDFWDSNTQYYINDVVKYGTKSYKCIQAVTGYQPFYDAFWTLFSPTNVTIRSSKFVNQLAVAIDEYCNLRFENSSFIPENTSGESTKTIPLVFANYANVDFDYSNIFRLYNADLYSLIDGGLNEPNFLTDRCTYPNLVSSVYIIPNTVDADFTISDFEKLNLNKESFQYGFVTGGAGVHYFGTFENQPFCIISDATNDGDRNNLTNDGITSTVKVDALKGLTATVCDTVIIILKDTNIIGSCSNNDAALNIIYINDGLTPVGQVKFYHNEDNSVTSSIGIRSNQKFFTGLNGTIENPEDYKLILYTANPLEEGGCGHWVFDQCVYNSDELSLLSSTIIYFGNTCGDYNLNSHVQLTFSQLNCEQREHINVCGNQHAYFKFQNVKGTLKGHLINNACSPFETSLEITCESDLRVSCDKLTIEISEPHCRVPYPYKGNLCDSENIDIKLYHGKYDFDHSLHCGNNKNWYRPHIYFMEGQCESYEIYNVNRCHASFYAFEDVKAKVTFNTTYGINVNIDECQNMTLTGPQHCVDSVLSNISDQCRAPLTVTGTACFDHSNLEFRGETTFEVYGFGAIDGDALKSYDIDTECLKVNYYTLNTPTTYDFSLGNRSLEYDCRVNVELKSSDCEGTYQFLNTSKPLKLKVCGEIGPAIVDSTFQSGLTIQTYSCHSVKFTGSTTITGDDSCCTTKAIPLRIRGSGRVRTTCGSNLTLVTQALAQAYVQLGLRECPESCSFKADNCSLTFQRLNCETSAKYTFLVWTVGCESKLETGDNNLSQCGAEPTHYVVVWPTLHCITSDMPFQSSYEHCNEYYVAVSFDPSFIRYIRHTSSGYYYTTDYDNTTLSDPVLICETIPIAIASGHGCNSATDVQSRIYGKNLTLQALEQHCGCWNVVTKEYTECMVEGIFNDDCHYDRAIYSTRYIGSFCGERQRCNSVSTDATLVKTQLEFSCCNNFYAGDFTGEVRFIPNDESYSGQHTAAIFKYEIVELINCNWDLPQFRSSTNPSCMRGEWPQTLDVSEDSYYYDNNQIIISSLADAMVTVYMQISKKLIVPFYIFPHLAGSEDECEVKKRDAGKLLEYANYCHGEPDAEEDFVTYDNYIDYQRRLQRIEPGSCGTYSFKVIYNTSEHVYYRFSDGAALTDFELFARNNYEDLSIGPLFKSRSFRIKNTDYDYKYPILTLDRTFIPSSYNEDVVATVDLQSNVVAVYDPSTSYSDSFVTADVPLHIFTPIDTNAPWHRIKLTGLDTDSFNYTFSCSSEYLRDAPVIDGNSIILKLDANNREWIDVSLTLQSNIHPPSQYQFGSSNQNLRIETEYIMTGAVEDGYTAGPYGLVGYTSCTLMTSIEPKDYKVAITNPAVVAIGVGSLNDSAAGLSADGSSDESFSFSKGDTVYFTAKTFGQLPANKSLRVNFSSIIQTNDSNVKGGNASNNGGYEICKHYCPDNYFTILTGEHSNVISVHFANDHKFTGRSHTTFTLDTNAVLHTNDMNTDDTIVITTLRSIIGNESANRHRVNFGLGLGLELDSQTSHLLGAKSDGCYTAVAEPDQFLYDNDGLTIQPTASNLAMTVTANLDSIPYHLCSVDDAGIRLNFTFKAVLSGANISTMDWVNVGTDIFCYADPEFTNLSADKTRNYIFLDRCNYNSSGSNANSNNIYIIQGPTQYDYVEVYMHATNRCGEQLSDIDYVNLPDVNNKIKIITYDYHTAPSDLLRARSINLGNWTLRPDEAGNLIVTYVGNETGTVYDRRTVLVFPTQNGTRQICTDC